MLIRFSVENFRSFKSCQTLDLSAVKTCKEWQDENTVETAQGRVLRSAVIYGANASGKTNLFLAMARMRSFMLSSIDIDKNQNGLWSEPFLLDTYSKSEPTTFEIDILLDGHFYNYGFSILGVGGNYEVEREWLIEVERKKEKEIFLRVKNVRADGAVNGSLYKVDLNKMPEVKDLHQRTRADALFFTVAAQFAEPICQRIAEYIRNSWIIISGVNHDAMGAITARCLEESSQRADAIRQFIRNADVGIQDLLIGSGGRIQTIHNVRDRENEIVNHTIFDLFLAESQGTKKLFDFAACIVDALREGYILVIDELDAKLHPSLMRNLVLLFNNSEINPNNAQLIFNAQNIDLLGFKAMPPGRKRKTTRLRRDQFYFVEKDNCEASNLYSLIEFKNDEGQKVRNDDTFDKEYMQGAYGAVPFVGMLVAEK